MNQPEKAKLRPLPKRHSGVGRVWKRAQIEHILLLILVALLLAAWEWLGAKGAISRLFYPPPSQSYAALREWIVDGELIRQIAATTRRLGIGFVAGSGMGVTLGIFMGWLAPVRRFAEPVVSSTYPIPKIAIFPLLLAILGLGDQARIVTIALAAFFPPLINTVSAITQIPNQYLEIAISFKAKRWRIISRVLFPASLPTIMSGLRIGLNSALLVTIVVEILTAHDGIGSLIWFSWQTFRIEELYASLFVIGLLGIVSNYLMLSLTRWVTPWVDFNPKT